MNQQQIRAAAARAADAILDGQDPEQHMAGLEDDARALAASIVESCTGVPCWHAEKIAALGTVQARRAALEGLPAKLQPAVKRRLAALWKAREPSA